VIPRKEVLMKPSFSQTMISPSDIACAAIYARVSTEDQGKGFSIPTQLDACRKLAEREGYMVSEDYVLIDEGLSATMMDRPGLRTLRDLVNVRAIAAVIIYDPDRLSRNVGHQLLLAKEFEGASVKLVIVSHPMEQGPEGWLFFQMRGALAGYERAKTQERTKRGMLGRAKAGNPWGGQHGLGYRAVPSSTARPLTRPSVSFSPTARWRRATGNISICSAAGASAAGGAGAR
jgi:site-specific DNA recombinase